ncbi:CHAT domain-containing protein [Amycolatopsis sp. NPDC003731]
MSLERLPTHLSERERLVQALASSWPAAWDIVVAALPYRDAAPLRRPGQAFITRPLWQVLTVAGVIAELHGSDRIDLPHIVISLELTSECRNKGIDLSKNVAEAFELPPFDHLDEVLTTHHQRITARSEMLVDDVDVLLARHALIWRRSTIIGYFSTIGIGFLAMTALAFKTESAVVWVALPFTLVSFADSRSTETQLFDAGKLTGRISTRWPAQFIPVAITAAAGAPHAAWVLLAEYFLVEIVMTIGGSALARQSRFSGPTFDLLPDKVRLVAAIPDAFLASKRLFTLGITVALGVAPVVLAPGLSQTDHIFYIMAAVMIGHQRAWFGVIFLVIATTMNVSTEGIILALGSGLLTRAAISWSWRPPAAPVPVPLRGVRGVPRLRGSEGQACRRARHLLRRGLFSAAEAELSSHPGAHPIKTALHGWALLESGHPGAAQDAVSKLPESLSPIRTLVIACSHLELSEPRTALTVLAETNKPIGRAGVRRQLATEIQMTRLRAETLLSEDTVPTLARWLTLSSRRTNALRTMRTIRLIAENHSTPPAAASMIAIFAYRFGSWYRKHIEVPNSTLLQNERVLWLESMRLLTVWVTANIAGDRQPIDPLEALGRDTGAAEFFLRADRPLEAVDVLNQLADHLEISPHHPAALDTRIEAAATLHWLRHQFHDLATRRAWWARAAVTLSAAIRQAASRKDWATLAELIETARLQLAPREDEDLADRTKAPFVRVRGTSRMATTVWYSPQERPVIYDLERLAAIVLGRGTWWWSTWAVGTELYWSVVPPDGEVYGGVMDVGPSSSLGQALADLRRASPSPMAKESVGSPGFEARMADSVLLGPPSAEAELSMRLAALIPHPLREHLARNPLTDLAIAPDRVLAGVPWSTIGTGVGEFRLLERCRLAIAPPASLLAALAGRPWHDGHRPLSLAVLNPGGRLGPPSLDLLAASALAYALPAKVPKIVRGNDVTLESVGALLRSLPPACSFLFAGHTHPGADEPLGGGLLLRPPDGHRDAVVLSARDLIDHPGCYPIPSQGLVLACDTADLAQAAAGEWLVLGTALLWAGARRLIVTGFPVLDTTGIDEALVRCLLSGDDLVDGLRAIQLEQLTQWRASGAADVSPAIWGGHIAMGAFTSNIPLKEITVGADQQFALDLIWLLDSAAEAALRRNRNEVAPSDVLVELALEATGWLPRTRGRTLVAVSWLANSFFPGAWQLHGPSGKQAGLHPTTRDLLRRATTYAAEARHGLVTTKHLLVAMLAGSGAAPGLARWATRYDGRHPEVIKEIIADSQSNAAPAGGFRGRSLRPEDVDVAYRECGIRPPR